MLFSARTTVGDRRSDLAKAPSLLLACALLLALSVLRYIGLHYSVVDLFVDESQYWAWSRELAFGYYSKPPLIAWIVAGSHFVCGDGEACVRAASPALYLGTSLLIFVIANQLYGLQTAFWASLIVALSPGVVFSARIISTDVPLLFFWALALLAFSKLLQVPDWRWFLTLGLAFGLGMLAKYAMIYFLAGVMIAALFDRNVRSLLKHPMTWMALALAALMLLPNVLWNVSNGFVTLNHTGDNIRRLGFGFKPLGAFEFLASQFGVVGPLVFGASLVLMTRFAAQATTKEDRLMLAFAIPPIAAIAGLGLASTVEANWSAPALLSIVIVVTAVWVRKRQFIPIYATLAIGLTAQLVLLICDCIPYRISITALGATHDVYRRTLGWRGLGEAVGKLAQANGANTVVAAYRDEMASLTYYLRDAPQKVVSWPLTDRPFSQFDLINTLQEATAEPLLFVSVCPQSAPHLTRQYREVKSLSTFAVSSGPTSWRSYNAFLLSGPRGPVAPFGACWGS
jgi:4-amino-4-deoxy-L-arabinose transferase-like glycosyltransferase